MDQRLKLLERRQHLARQHWGGRELDHPQSVHPDQRRFFLPTLLPMLPRPLFFALLIDDPRTQSPVSLTFSAPQSAVMTKVGERGEREGVQCSEVGREGREREKRECNFATKFANHKVHRVAFPYDVCVHELRLSLPLRGFVIESFLQLNVALHLKASPRYVHECLMMEKQSSGPPSPLAIKARWTLSYLNGPKISARQNHRFASRREKKDFPPLSEFPWATTCISRLHS